MRPERNSPCKSGDNSWETSLKIQDARTRSGKVREGKRARPLVENEVENAASALEKNGCKCDPEADISWLRCDDDPGGSAPGLGDQAGMAWVSGRGWPG